MEKTKSKKSWYQKWWVWVIIVFVLFGLVGAMGDTETKKTESKPASATPAPAPAPPKWDVEAAYNAVQTGMTKTQVEAATGKSSANCYTSETSGFGSYEYCDYGTGFGDKGRVSVTYKDGLVLSKSKSTY